MIKLNNKSMNGENERIQRIENFLLDPERALFTTMEEFSAAINEILPILRGIDINTLATLQGEDGRTPERGVDYMTQEDIDALEAFILSKMPREDIDFLTIATTEAFIRAEIAKIPRIKGDKGDRGPKGEDGKDGSPDSGADILKKLRGLGKNQGLKMSDVRGLENRIKLYNAGLDELVELREKIDNQIVAVSTNQGGGSVPSAVAWGDITGTLANQTDLQTALNAKLSNITGLVSQGTGITITGTGVSGDPYVINASGSGGTPGGSTTQLQYNNAGAFGGISGATTDGTIVTLTSPTIATSLLANYATASTVAIFDASKNLISADTATYPSLTELSYVKGVTSSIQTQLNAKGVGTVTSVGASVPTGLTIAGSPVTGSGTLAIGLDTGYVIPLQSTLDGKANTALSNLSSVAINTSLLPGSNDGAALGSGTLSFSDLFLASGGVINWNNGNAIITHSTNSLAVSLDGGTVLSIAANNPETGISGTILGGLDYIQTLEMSNSQAAPAFRIIQASTGDAAARFAISTTRSYAFGIDNSDSDSFKISTAASGTATLGTGDIFSISSAGDMRLTGTVGTNSASVPTLGSTSTLTNKNVSGATNTLISKTTDASSATPTPTGDSNFNHYSLTALATDPTFAAPSGTPAEGNRLTIRIHDNGTARALSWNGIYRATNVALPTTTILGKEMYLGFLYDSTDSVWSLVARADEP